MNGKLSQAYAQQKRKGEIVKWTEDKKPQKGFIRSEKKGSKSILSDS